MDNIYSGSNASKIVTPGNNPEGSIAGSDISRVLPRQLSTGTLRGTQNVGYGGVQIDGSNNRIVLSANDTTVTIGDTSDTNNQTGIALTDSNNNPLVTLGTSTGLDSSTGLTIYDGSNTRRLIGGLYPNGKIKIALSQPGFDVATATDSQLIWSSDFDMFKIVATGSIDVTVGAGDSFNTQTSTVAHGLKTIPIVMAFVDGVNVLGGPGGRVQTPYTEFEEYTPGGGPTGRFDVIAYYYATADATNIYMNVLPGDVTFYSQVQGTYSFTYYVLQETSAA